MSRALALALLLVGGILALDQWTKRWVTETLQFHAPVEVFGPLVRLTYTRNSGVAFGLGAGTGFPYYLFSIAAIIVILAMFVRGSVRGAWQTIALALIMGGALGNLVDRLATGEVVDFIEVGWSRWHWPIFNVADSAVSIGVVMFALTWHRREQRTADAGMEASHAQDPGAVGGPAPRRGAAGSLPGGDPDGSLT